MLKSTTGTVLGQTLLNGTATGGLSVLVPGNINTVAGNNAWIYNGDGGPATEASIFLPMGIVVDAAGDLFLSDSNNNRIRRVDAKTQKISTVAGTGNPGFSGDGGLATAAEVSTPSGITIDGAGNLYFADTGNQVIRRIDAVTQLISTVAGKGNSQGDAGDGGVATSATLSLPEGLAFDSAENLYIADTGNDVIRMVGASDNVITTIVGGGGAGYRGDGGPALAARLNSPWSVTIGSDGSLYIADFANNAIRKVTGGIISTVAGNGSVGFAGDGGAATAAALDQPAGIVFDPAGNMYIADSGNNRVRKVYAADQTIQTITGINSEQFYGDTGPANLASLYGPYALFMDQAGNLLIADMFHNRVRTISASTVLLTYPTMRVGKLSVPQIETVANDGNSGLTLTAPALNGSALDPATTTCNIGAVVASGVSCELGVEFAPTKTGDPGSGTLGVKSDAANTPAVISLSGDVLSVEPTSVSLSSSANPSLLGTPVTFTANVASASTSLSGTMLFLDGSTQICSMSVTSAGAATCTAALAFGQHSITASYSGDAQDASAVSLPLVQTVQQAATITLTAAPNPALVLTSVALTATVTAPSGTPTGNVTFYDGANAIGSATLSLRGIGTVSVSTLTAGTHNLSAHYDGNTTDIAADSNGVSEIVQLATTTTTLSLSNASVLVGTQITLSSTVSSTDGPLPTGTVVFSSGQTILGTANLNHSGVASLVLSSLAVGNYSVVATYSGDNDSATSASPAMTETVQQIGTITTLKTSGSPASAGGTVQLTATIGVVHGEAADGAITGSVTFSDGATSLGTATVNAAGQATLAISTLAVGSHAITAAYGGSVNYGVSTSTVLFEQIRSTATTTVVSVPSATALAGEPVIFTITVNSSTGTPTGTVTIRNSGASVGQATLNAQGVATFTTSSLPVGNQSLSAVYGGDANYLTSTSASVPETVALATPILTLAGPATAVDVGTAVNVVATLTTNGVAPTGALTLRDHGVVISTQTISGAGSFSFSTSSLLIGSHTLTAAYAGNSDNAAAVSTSITVVVQQGPTVTAFSSSANPSTLGQSLTLTASVTSVSPDVTGSVAFEEGGTVLGSASLVNGTATFATSSLSFGSHTLTAVYSGDTDHVASSSAAITQQIVEPSTATLSSSYNPSVAGASVTFTAKIAGVGSVIPTGTILFADGGSALGTATLDATGAATFQTMGLAVGSHTISISYAGDKNYSSATATLIQTVQDANTQIGVIASTNPAVYGTPLSLSATITSNGAVPTGSITFTDGGASIGSITLTPSGVVTLTTSTLAPGAHTLVANYAGDGKAGASASTPLLVVVKQLTSVALASSANPSLTLSPVSLTATVVNSGVGVATGVVTFTDATTPLGTATLGANGQATLTVPSLAAGSHTILASYAGDGGDFSSTSSGLAEAVQLRPTTTTLTATATNAGNLLQVTLIGVVRWTGTTTPTGSITFTDASGTLGTAPVDSTGVATLTINLKSSTDSVSASYSGDTAYAASASSATGVSEGVGTQFTLTINPSTVSLQSKQHMVVTVTATSLQSFSDTLQMGCAGLPYAATCTFTNPQVTTTNSQMTLAANGSVTEQLLIDTGDPLGAGTTANNHGAKATGVMLCLLPGTLIAGLLCFRQRRRPWLPRLLPLLILLAASAAILGSAGCSGLQVNGTPAGSYSFKVTASGVNSGFTETQVVTLTVTQ